MALEGQSYLACSYSYQNLAVELTKYSKKVNHLATFNKIWSSYQNIPRKWTTLPPPTSYLWSIDPRGFTAGKKSAGSKVEVLAEIGTTVLFGALVNFRRRRSRIRRCSQSFSWSGVRYAVLLLISARKTGWPWWSETTFYWLYSWSSTILLNCYATLAFFATDEVELGKTVEQPNWSQQNLVFDHHGHPVQVATKT